MAKRGYKLQEFVAHSGNVNCLKIGKKTCRQFLTGGDDHVVNLWSVGKSEPLTSLNGHSSPIESVAFDSAEVLAVAGASSGVIKLWDLEETKVIRNLTGHRSYCTAVEFHPFGEFLASGSMDTNLKLWDIRKKGCTHTYKGHSRGISTMGFTPDGRWVVSGGLDNVVKVWDLTAGKLLQDFKLHEGHIRSLEFHPFEFLLATGSADRTIKFWDLETFEMISSTRRETAGVRSMKFHPDGQRLFCALDGSLKVYSWEPASCHDSVDMGWSTIGDLCVHDGKLLGGAYYENSVGVWVVDTSVVQLNGGSTVPKQNGHSEEKVELQINALEKSRNHRRSTSNTSRTSPDAEEELQKIALQKSEKHRISTSNARCTSPGTESEDIKNSHSEEKVELQNRALEKNKNHRRSTSNAGCTSPDTKEELPKIVLEKSENYRRSTSNAHGTSPDTEDELHKISLEKSENHRRSASNAHCMSPDTNVEFKNTALKKRENHGRPTSYARCTSPDTESKDIKNGHSEEKVELHNIASEKSENHRRSTSNASCTSTNIQEKNPKFALEKSDNYMRPTSNAGCTSPDTEEVKKIALEKSENHERPTSNVRCTSPDTESKDIKNGHSEEKVELQNIASEKSENYRRSTSNASCTSIKTVEKNQNFALEKSENHRRSTSNAGCTSPDTEEELQKIALEKSENHRRSTSNSCFTPQDAEVEPLNIALEKSENHNAHCTSPDSEVEHHSIALEKSKIHKRPTFNARCTTPDMEEELHEVALDNHRRSTSDARCTPPDAEVESQNIALEKTENHKSTSYSLCTSPDTEVELQTIAFVKSENHRLSTSNARCTSPDTESTDIKNIYVDCESPVSSKIVGSLCSPKAMALPDSKKVKSPASQKQGSRALLHAKRNESTTKKSFVVPILVPRDCHDPKDMASSKRDSVSTARINAGSFHRPTNTRKAPNMKFDTEALSTLPDSGSFSISSPTTLPRPANRKKAPATKSDAATVSVSTVLGSFRNSTNTSDFKRGANHVRKPSITKLELETVSTSLEYSPSRAKESVLNAKKAHVQSPSSTTKFSTVTMPVVFESESFGTENSFDKQEDPNCKGRLNFDNNARDSSEEQDSSFETVNGKMGKLFPLTQSNLQNDVQNDVRGANPAKVVSGVTVVHGRTRNLVERFEKREVCSNVEALSPDTAPHIERSSEIASTAPSLSISAERTSTALDNDQPVADREDDPPPNDNHVIQILLQNHDGLLSTLTSHLAKLQVIRQFLERNDVKGAINLMKKLSDHYVQSDVVSVLVERVEIITLDLFSCLLPVLLHLLDAKVERHTSVSLEMLLKLVAVFGQLVRSTVSAPPAVGVDLHAEQRLKSCKECFVYLQTVEKMLPTLIRRGGAVGRYALELNLLLQQP